jgi:hypothetical protein
MDKVFKWISRANGVLLLLLLAGVGIQVAIWNWPRDRSQSRHVAVATEPANTDEAPVPLVLGEVETVAGSDVLMIPLGTEEDSMKLGSGPRYRHEMRNMLFLAGNGQRATWLFEANGNLLRDLDQLSWRPDRDSHSPTVALYFEYAAGDINGDHEINRNDTFTVALAKPDGSGVSEILQGVTRVLSHDLVDEQTMALVYQIDKTIWHARYRVSTFEKLSEQAVIDVPDRL